MNCIFSLIWKKKSSGLRYDAHILKQKNNFKYSAHTQETITKTQVEMNMSWSIPIRTCSVLFLFICLFYTFLLGGGGYKIFLRFNVFCLQSHVRGSPDIHRPTIGRRSLFCKNVIILYTSMAKSRKYQGVFEVKSRVKTWQVRGIGLNNWSISKSQNGVTTPPLFP